MSGKTVFLVAALWALALPVAHGGKLYKWVDKDGNVSYHDQPPSPSEPGYRVEEKAIRAAEKPAPQGNLGEIAAKNPIVLYTIPKCSGCDLARMYFQKRKLPFTEKSVESDVKSQDELKQKSGGFSVPTILIGTKVMRGFMESLLDGELEQAGYPNPEAAEKDKEAKP